MPDSRKGSRLAYGHCMRIIRESEKVRGLSTRSPLINLGLIGHKLPITSIVLSLLSLAVLGLIKIDSLSWSLHHTL